MAVVRQDGDKLMLIRNHEISGRGKTFGKSENTYDPAAPGGCTVMTFDTARERMTSSFVGIGGTIQNCAGGGTPWGTWLTCEENLGDKDTMNTADFEFVGYSRDHGWVFEVSPTQPTIPKPYIEMGRFVHEAVAVDPVTGIVYLTEDSNPAGMYRYIPNTPGVLGNGGKLEMMVVEGKKDTRKGVVAGESFKTRWVPIADPTLAHSPNSTDGKGVFKQGEKQGGASFARLEGIFFAEDRFVITATSGGDASQGQVWEYLPREERLRLLFASPGKDVLNMPDNLCITKRGCVMLCEDGGRQGQRLHALTPQGELFPFAENMVQLNGQKNGFRGDYRSTEWSGVCFSPDGKWLFANIQTPGMTFAITGPWEKGPI
jgi:secreted PhoX family phosphatase